MNTEVMKWYLEKTNVAESDYPLMQTILANIIRYANRALIGNDARARFIRDILGNVSLEESYMLCDESGALENNTRVSYLYRDASNYKSWNEVILAGTLTKEQVRTIMSLCDSGEYFIPSQVGLPEVRFSDISEDDHVWFELAEEGFQMTTAKPTELITAEELYQNFLSVNGKWDDTTCLYM